MFRLSHELMHACHLASLHDSVAKEWRTSKFLSIHLNLLQFIKTCSVDIFKIQQKTRLLYEILTEILKSEDFEISYAQIKSGDLGRSTLFSPQFFTVFLECTSFR